MTRLIPLYAWMILMEKCSAYNGTPLIPVDEKWTQKEILTKLEETRNSYVNYKMRLLNK